MKGLGEQDRHVLPAETSYKNASFSHKRLLHLLEPVLLYMAVDVISL
jgi:hypothetical protein